MRHVFVETNWVVEYAAPAHRKTPAALELLDRAAREEIRLYLPVICVTEARRPVAERFQVRTEADRVRQFLIWARDTSIVDAAEDETTRRVLDRMESRVKADLDGVDHSLESLRTTRGVEVFNLDQEMLERCASLSYLRLDLKPFDQAILAAILVRAEQLRSKGVDDRIFANWTPIYSHGTGIATLNGNWQNSITKLESPCTETSC
jgi:predicted nucleic acid-binding protein